MKVMRHYDVKTHRVTMLLRVLGLRSRPSTGFNDDYDLAMLMIIQDIDRYTLPRVGGHINERARWVNRTYSDASGMLYIYGWGNPAT